MEQETPVNRIVRADITSPFTDPGFCKQDRQALDKMLFLLRLLNRSTDLNAGQRPHRR